MPRPKPGQEPLVKVTEEFKRRVREGVQRHWDDPVASAAHRAAISGPQSDETRRKKSDAEARRSPEAEALRRRRIADSMRRARKRQREVANAERLALGDVDPEQGDGG